MKQKVRSVSGILKMDLVELNKLKTEIVIIDPKSYQSTHFSYTMKRIECSAKDILTSSVQYDKILSKFGNQQLVNHAYGFNQSQTGKYFE